MISFPSPGPSTGLSPVPSHCPISGFGACFFVPALALAPALFAHYYIHHSAFGISFKTTVRLLVHVAYGHNAYGCCEEGAINC